MLSTAVVPAWSKVPATTSSPLKAVIARTVAVEKGSQPTCSDSGVPTGCHCCPSHRATQPIWPPFAANGWPPAYSSACQVVNENTRPPSPGAAVSAAHAPLCASSGPDSRQGSSQPWHRDRVDVGKRG